MTLAELLRHVAGQPPFDTAERAPDASSAEVSTIAYDSRQADRGCVFVALRGLHANGVSFARDAIARGAVAVVAEASPPGVVVVPWIVVSDARLALAALSATFFGRPSEEMTLVGITGTNGKTTTAYILTSIFEAAGVRCGRIGTVGYRIGDREYDAARTTPEAPDVQRMLRDMRREGCGACAMEVSSHALSMRRADYVQFAAGVFTNLTRDHLDFHRDMESYFAAKRRLFELLPGDAPGIVNLDDRRGAEFAAACRRPVTYAIDAAADVRPASPLSLSLDGLAFHVSTPHGTLQIHSRLVGRPNAYNILAAVAAGVSLDLPSGAIEQGVAELAMVPGRFQVVSERNDDVRVVVDYAHTDDALRNLLETARAMAPARIITVFGCGGDRDRTKRPLMGAVAARTSDLVIVTSDNPRSEDPAQILEEIKRGIVMPADRVAKGQPAPRATPLLTIADRRTAIDTAIREARPGDLVLVAGKGHEKTQVIGDRVLPFDDVDVARAALGRRRTTRVS